MGVLAQKKWCMSINQWNVDFYIINYYVSCMLSPQDQQVLSQCRHVDTSGNSGSPQLLSTISSRMGKTELPGSSISWNNPKSEADSWGMVDCGLPTRKNGWFRIRIWNSTNLWRIMRRRIHPETRSSLLLIQISLKNRILFILFMLRER